MPFQHAVPEIKTPSTLPSFLPKGDFIKMIQFPTGVLRTGCLGEGCMYVFSSFASACLLNSRRYNGMK